MSYGKQNLPFVLLYYWIYETCCEKEIKCEASLAFYLFSSTCLINSIKHEHSCKILYIHYRRVAMRRPWSLGFNIIREKTRETLLLIANNKGTNLPANRRSLISALIIRYLKSKVRLLVLFDMIWFFTSHQQTFSYVGTGLPWLNQYKAMINVSCSRTQRSDAGEARTCSPSVSKRALPLSNRAPL